MRCIWKWLIDERRRNVDFGIEETIVTNSVTIFLASSSELSRERDFIGNRVRMLSDEWETRGIRIVLNIWDML